MWRGDGDSGCEGTRVGVRGVSEVAPGPSMTAGVGMMTMLQEENRIQKLSGDRVYCTNALLLPIKIMLCSRLH